MRPQSKSFVKLTVLTRCYGIQSNHLKSRGVEPEIIDYVKQYDVDLVTKKCADLIVKHLTPDDAGAEGRSLIELKRDETEQRVRKLKIENDVTEGLLVDVAEIKVAFGQKVRAVCDILDGIPTRVKMNAPDVSQAVLEVVQRSVTEVRNRAADHRLENIKRPFAALDCAPSKLFSSPAGAQTHNLPVFELLSREIYEI